MTTADEPLPSYEKVLLRALHFGVSWGDLQEAAAQARSWEDWSRVLADRAGRYEAAAEAAAREERGRSAQEGWRRAADAYHVAQLRLAHGLRRWELQARCRRAFARLAPRLSPPAVRIELPFRSATLPGWFRRAGEDAPCVLLIGGLDSAKEVELCVFGEAFLARGCSVLFFDAPGQGELAGVLPMPLDFETVAAAAIDGLAARGLADPERTGLFGVSFGGHLACRAAAADPRVAACVCLGGFFDGRILSRLPPLGVAAVRRTFGVAGEDGLADLARRLTLEPLRGRMDRPFLAVHGGADEVVDSAQIEALRGWAAGPARIWTIEGAEHVCTSRFGECLPVVGDWMAGELAAAERPARGRVRR